MSRILYSDFKSITTNLRINVIISQFFIDAVFILFEAMETESHEYKKQLKEIGVQCNLATLPPLGTDYSQTDSDDDDDGNDDEEMYCPPNSDSDEEMETKEMTSEEQEKLKG